MPSSSQHLMNLEYECSAHNYHPVPVVFSQAKGSSIWDPEGNKYLDFLSAYSAVNQSVSHSVILSEVVGSKEIWGFGLMLFVVRFLRMRLGKDERRYAGCGCGRFGGSAIETIRGLEDAHVIIEGRVVAQWRS
ncbi:ornithine aminotransferase [Sarracenia purpurea var. burkii]